MPGTLSLLASKAVNTLIDAFPVPPFLLPIYEAAASDFGVPWPVLAAINEVETDYGRNLSISSAGAVGWMQFLPSTWAKYGLDADGRGTPNPYDPVDAIFAAARYLHAAGGGRNLRRAVFAYNHANWYVNSVLLRATLLQDLPPALIDGLAGLMEASFPVAGHLRQYATQAPKAIRFAGAPGVMLSAPAGAPVIAVADGRVVAVGRSPKRGRYVTIEDAYGNRFTYSRLGSVARIYPVLKPRRESAAQIAGSALLTLAKADRGRTPVASDPAASASATGVSAKKPATPRQGQAAQPAPMAKERLFANPLRPASYAAGGRLQLQSSVTAYALATGLEIGGQGPSDYFSQPVRLRPRDIKLAALRRGETVVAGTVLGRVARVSDRTPGIVFQIRPKGAKAPLDPRAIIAGWELLGRLTAGRAALVGSGKSGAYGARNVTLGQLLLAGKPALERAVLSDRKVSIYSCGRRDIRAGLVDRRVLAVIEYLSYSGLAPTVSGLVCGQPAGSGAQLGTKLQISALAGTPVAGHQRDGGIVDAAVRALLQLQGALRPEQVVSLRSYPWQPAAIALSDHATRLEVDFSAPGGAGSGSTANPLDGAQWKRLIGRLARLGGQPAAPTPSPSQTDRGQGQ